MVKEMLTLQHCPGYPGLCQAVKLTKEYEMDVKLTLEELKELVKKVELESKKSMLDYIIIDINKKHIYQPCAYAECNSTYYNEGQFIN